MLKFCDIDTEDTTYTNPDLLIKCLKEACEVAEEDEIFDYSRPESIDPSAIDNSGFIRVSEKSKLPSVSGTDELDDEELEGSRLSIIVYQIDRFSCWFELMVVIFEILFLGWFG